MKTQSQVEFEAWAVSAGYYTRHYFDGYYCSATQDAWKGWSARDAVILELSAKLAAGKGE